MSVYSLTGNDNFILNDRVINELSDGSTIEIAYQNDRVGVSTGKNGNTVFAENKTGLNAVATLRVIRGGKDDKYLNSLSIQQNKDLPSFSLMNGSFTKRVGDGTGTVKFDNYVLLGGAFQRFPDVQENLVGETEQGTVVYTIIFAKAERALA
jgi:hypothetical protein